MAHAGGIRAPDLARLAGRRILVAEDEAIIALAYEALLQGLGCVVLGPVTRVQQALALLAAERDPPDAAVLDVNLDGETSGAVAEALAARGVPFMVVTGYAVLAEHLGGAIRAAPRLLKPAIDEEFTRLLAELACRPRACRRGPA